MTNNFLLNTTKGDKILNSNISLNLTSSLGLVRNNPINNYKKYTYKIQGKDESGNEIKDILITKDLIDNSIISDKNSDRESHYDKNLLDIIELHSDYGSETDEVNYLYIIISMSLIGRTLTIINLKSNAI
jgi:hypothetical protein